MFETSEKHDTLPKKISPERTGFKSPRVTPLEARVVKTGSTLVFKSKIQGIPQPEVSWMKNGKNLVIDENVTITTEESVSILTITNMNRKRAGKYEIVAINSVGEARSSGSVVVSDTVDSPELRAPRFTIPLQPKTVLEDDVVILEATVESYPQSSFNWFINATPVNKTENCRIINKENKSILIVEPFQKINSGLYTCRAENVAGSVTSTASVKIVQEELLEDVQDLIPPTFTKKLLPLQLMDGDELVLSACITGNPVPNVKWFHNDQLIEERRGTTISQDTDGNCVFTIAEVYPEDAGEYICHASNKIGEASNTITVTIKGTKVHVNIYVASISVSSTPYVKCILFNLYSLRINEWTAFFLLTL